MTPTTIKKLKRLIEFIFYYTLDFFLAPNKKNRSKKHGTAIIQTKLIGDFFVSLPFLNKEIEDSNSKAQTVTIITSKQLKDTIHSYFPHTETICIDTSRFTKDLLYRKKILHEVYSRDFNIIINENVPRDGLVGDAIIRASRASITMGYKLINADRHIIDRAFYQRHYTDLIDSDIKQHQSQLHEHMLAHLGIRSEALSPDLLSRHIDSTLAELCPYFIVAPGASVSARRWAACNFVDLCKKILKENSMIQCVIIGTNAELDLCEKIEIQLDQSRVTNLCGKTSQINLISIIGKAEFVIANDSAAGHIATVYGVKSVIITGGGHYGRFFPYPQNSTHVKTLPTIVHKEMPCYGCDWNCKFATNYDQPFPCIDLITIDDAWEKVKHIVHTRANQYQPQQASAQE